MNSGTGPLKLLFDKSLQSIRLCIILLDSTAEGLRSDYRQRTYKDSNDESFAMAETIDPVNPVELKFLTMIRDATCLSNLYS